MLGTSQGRPSAAGGGGEPCCRCRLPPPPSRSPWSAGGRGRLYPSSPAMQPRTAALRTRPHQQPRQAKSSTAPGPRTPLVVPLAAALVAAAAAAPAAALAAAAAAGPLALALAARPLVTLAQLAAAHRHRLVGRQQPHARALCGRKACGGVVVRGPQAPAAREPRSRSSEPQPTAIERRHGSTAGSASAAAAPQLPAPRAPDRPSSRASIACTSHSSPLCRPSTTRMTWRRGWGGWCGGAQGGKRGALGRLQGALLCCVPLRCGPAPALALPRCRPPPAPCPGARPPCAARPAARPLRAGGARGRGQAGAARWVGRGELERPRATAGARTHGGEGNAEGRRRARRPPGRHPPARPPTHPPTHPACWPSSRPPRPRTPGPSSPGSRLLRVVGGGGSKARHEVQCGRRAAGLRRSSAGQAADVHRRAVQRCQPRPAPARPPAHAPTRLDVFLGLLLGGRCRAQAQPLRPPAGRREAGGQRANGEAAAAGKPG